MDTTDVTSIALLGPVRVIGPHGAVTVPAGRQRALLAALALRAPRPVTVSELVDAVWDDDPPDRARSTLQTYVSKLRRNFGPIIDHGPAGYSLAAEVTTDVSEVRSALDRLEGPSPPSPDTRAGLALATLRTWEGPALADVRDGMWFTGPAAELDELRGRLTDTAAAALIEAGRAPTAVSLLEARSHDDPIRETAQVLLVRALHAAGRTPEAVRAASRYRRWLRDETGLDPGQAFVAAEQAALAGDDRDSRPARGRSPTSGAVLARPGVLVGRASDLAALRDLLESERLVTVTGTGGVGKTRLVAELAAGGDGADWVIVELAPVEPGGVAAALGATLGYRADAVDERIVSELLGSAVCTLVLDNCEHVVGEVRRLARRVIDTCPGVRVLATSRVRLELPDESVVTLSPLPADGVDSPAVELFVDRLRRVRPDVEPHDAGGVLVDLCARLDGVPLALELAASRAATLGVETLAARLDHPLEMLAATTARESRHRSLATTIAWSVELLDAPARRLLGALSGFHGSFDVDAAEEVGGAVVEGPCAPLLGQLVDASLVAAVAEHGRFRLLDTIRDFAATQLVTAPDRDRLRRAHARWVAGELQAIAESCAGPDESATTSRLDMMRFDIEAALDRCGRTGDAAALADVVSPLSTPLLYRPDHDLLRTGLAAARDAAGPDPAPALSAAGARCAFLLGDLANVELLAHSAIDLSTDGSPERTRAAHALGVVRLYQGRFEESRRWFERVADDDATGLADRLDALGGLGLALCYLRRADESRHVIARHRAMADVLDSDTYRAFAEYVAGEVALTCHDPDEAITRMTAASELAWSVGATFVWGISSTSLAAALVRHRPADDARRHLPTLLARWRRTATWPQLWTTLRVVAEVIHESGRPDVALLILEAADRDAAAPTPVGDDAARVEALRGRLEQRLGSAAAAGIRAAAAETDRVAVLDRAAATLTA